MPTSSRRLYKSLLIRVCLKKGLNIVTFLVLPDTTRGGQQASDNLLLELVLPLLQSWNFEMSCCPAELAEQHLPQWGQIRIWMRAEVFLNKDQEVSKGRRLLV